METKKVQQGYIIRLQKGEEVMTSIKQICEENNIKAGSLSGIGASNSLSVSFYSEKEKGYVEKSFQGSYEITSVVGNISTYKEDVIVHLHINVSDEKYNVIGGHLNEAWISATFEAFLNVYDIDLVRKHDSEVNLNLLDLS